MNREAAARLFEGWDEALIWSCLQGHMGTLTADDEEQPESALIDIGDFCFLAGTANAGLLKALQGNKLLIPRDRQWELLIEHFFGDKATRMLRYAIKKETDVFDVDKLKGYCGLLDSSYEIRLIDEEMFEMAEAEPWSADLCSQFADYEDYRKRAVGVGILHKGKLVAGASPYGVYDGGIEIEIDTKPEYRRKGLATACGARLILECLERGLYPSWDAHDLRSVALAEKLGYRMDCAYVAYELMV